MSKLAELATDPSAHAMVAVLGWLVLRVEQLHRRWHSLGRRVRRLEKHRRREALRQVPSHAITR